MIDKERARASYLAFVFDVERALIKERVGYIPGVCYCKMCRERWINKGLLKGAKKEENPKRGNNISNRIADEGSL